MANAYDFTIDTLDFRCATSKSTPYVRSTAPFRKEQFDSSQQAGDQSLTGWWTRGQYSFHKGAGIKYYDVSSDEVLDRFASSSGASVWNAGQVAAAPAPSTLPGPHVSGQSAYTSVAYTAGHMVSVVGGKLFIDATQVTTLSVPTDTVYDVAVQSSGTVLVATANRIEQGGVNSGGAYSPGPVLWTNTNAGTSSDNFNGVFWAKGRIWAYDVSGNWYALPLSTGTIPAGGGSYLFWAKGPKSGTNTGLVETPGPVLIHDNRYIYSVSLATDGTVPAVSSPTAVVDMGTGSGTSVGIQSVAYGRGWIGVLTDSAFVAGQMAPDGSVTLGPDLVKFYGNSVVPAEGGKSVIAVRDKMYFAACAVDSTYTDLYVVNLSDTTGTLQPTWTQLERYYLGGHVRLAPDSGGYRFLAASYSYDSRVYFPYSGEVAGATQSPVSATLETGYHRFGTLEDKQFYSITVTARCTNGGTIKVYRLDGAGNSTLLGSAGDGKTELSLAATTPTEKMAFRFDFSFGFNSPTIGDVILLGYQVKALPVPQRQRILKVPLVVADRVETRWKRDTGKAGRAWSDLQKLEALESSKAIVSFTDHRTGETGSAYIDSIDFQGEVPTDGVSSNFGGVAYATLRVVSTS